MKTLKITRKPGPFAKMRSLAVLVDGVKVGSIKQNETLSIEVDDTAKAISGRMDWARTEAFPIGDLADGTDMVVWTWWTWNPLRMLGIQTIPMKFDLPVD